MRTDAKKLKRFLLLSLPYLIFGLLCTNVGEAFRMSEGADLSAQAAAYFRSLGLTDGQLESLRAVLKS